MSGTDGTSPMGVGSNDGAPAASSSLAPTATSASAPAATSSSASATETPQPQQPKELTYGELQEILNKFADDLQEQEEIFHANAKKVNEYDKVLVSNGDKILKLQSSVDDLKKDQTRIDKGLKHLKVQQMELESVLGQMELSIPEAELLEADANRLSLFNLNMNVHQELSQMNVDLGTLIEKINERNKREHKLHPNDPLHKIMKILNEHTDLLQWIEGQCGDLKLSLTDIQKQHLKVKEDNFANLLRQIQDQEI